MRQKHNVVQVAPVSSNVSQMKGFNFKRTSYEFASRETKKNNIKSSKEIVMKRVIHLEVIFFDRHPNCRLNMNSSFRFLL